MNELKQLLQNSLIDKKIGLILGILLNQYSYLYEFLKINIKQNRKLKI